MRMTRSWAGLSLTALLAGLGTVPAHADDTVRIGALATLEGPFADPGKDSMRGVELAIDEVGGTVAGKKIVLVKASSDGNPEVALQSARRLVDQDKVQILVGPLSGSEGIAMRDYAKTVPGVTFFNGSSAAIETTLVDPAPNSTASTPRARSGPRRSAPTSPRTRAGRRWSSSRRTIRSPTPRSSASWGPTARPAVT